MNDKVDLLEENKNLKLQIKTLENYMLFLAEGYDYLSGQEFSEDLKAYLTDIYEKSLATTKEE